MTARRCDFCGVLFVSRSVPPWCESCWIQLPLPLRYAMDELLGVDGGDGD